MNPDLHPRIRRCLENSWTELDVILETYADGLTPEHVTARQRCREELVEVIVALINAHRKE